MPASTITVIGGSPQSTTVLAPFAVPLQVQVSDAAGNPSSGVAVTFAAPATGASATLSSLTATTDTGGHASVTAVANATVGSYAVTASVTGVATPASFALSNAGGTGVNLTFTQQPGNTAAGTVITPAVVVKVTDSGGNPVSGVTIALTAQGGVGVLSGATPVATDASGLATFSTLSIDKTGTYTLQASDGTRVINSASFAISPGTSSSITVVAGSGQSAAVTTNYASQLESQRAGCAGQWRSRYRGHLRRALERSKRHLLKDRRSLPPVASEVAPPSPSPPTPRWALSMSPRAAPASLLRQCSAWRTWRVQPAIWYSCSSLPTRWPEP